MYADIAIIILALIGIALCVSGRMRIGQAEGRIRMLDKRLRGIESIEMVVVPDCDCGECQPVAKTLRDLTEQ